MTMTATTTNRRENLPLVPGVSPQVYGAADFARIADMVRAQSGIVLSDSKRMLVYSRLAPLLRKNACSTFAEFVERVETDDALATLTIAALTTNHTYFNRESHHFEHFAEFARPQLLGTLNAGGPARIWSAGCSSGEEIWTLMMVLLGADKNEGKRLLRTDLLALASDLAGHAIAAGMRAEYDPKAMEAVPEALRHNWCTTSGFKTSIRDDVRSLVRFRQLNLLGDWPFRTHFDVIFCRNVMIYFDHQTKEQLVWRLANQLRHGGYLYIGHSERVSGPASEILEPVGPTVYQRGAK